MLELACSLVFFGRCDEHGRDSSPHAGDCKRTPPPPPSLQYRHRQGTQGQRQVDAGLRTEKVGIAYNWAGATCPGAWLGSSHNPDAANNTLLFPRLARAASACPGLAIGCPGPPREPHGWGRMTCISRPPRSLQGAGSDEALVRVPGITPRAQSAWDYPQGSRLFAHATRRHRRRRDAPDSGLWLPGRQGRQEQTTAQDWERVHRAGGANPPFSVFLSIHGTARVGSPQAGSWACTALVWVSQAIHEVPVGPTGTPCRHHMSTPRGPAPPGSSPSRQPGVYWLRPTLPHEITVQ